MFPQQSRLVAAMLAGLILPAIHHSGRGEDLKPMSLTVEQAKEIVAGKKIELLRNVPN